MLFDAESTRSHCVRNTTVARLAKIMAKNSNRDAKFISVIFHSIDNNDTV